MAYHKINGNNYKIDLEEGEYDDLKGNIISLDISSNTIVLFINKEGKDQVFINSNQDNKNNKNKSDQGIVNKTCNINCNNLILVKIVRYDEYKKSNNKYIIVYQYPDYNFNKNDGFEVKLYVGKYTSNELKKLGINDSISSIRISPNMRLTIYDEDNFKGIYKTIINNSSSHKMIRSTNINETIGYKNNGMPIYHNWKDNIVSLNIE